MQGGGSSEEGTEKTRQMGSTEVGSTELTDGIGYMLRSQFLYAPSSNTDRQ